MFFSKKMRTFEYANAFDPYATTEKDRYDVVARLLHAGPAGTCPGRIFGTGSSLPLLTNFPYPHLSYLMLYDKEIIDRKKPADETSFFEWTHFKIELVAQQDSLFSILENGITVADRIALPDDRSVKIIFGADYGSRQVISDVAPFMIRNLAIRTTPGKVDCFWPLDALSEGPYVYDTRHDRPALLLNPRIDNHDRWKKVASLDFDSRAFFVKGAGNTGYFITRNGVQQYDFARNAMVARMIRWVRFFQYRTVEEFYDLRTDPDALHNLIDDPAYARQVASFRRAMEQKMRECGDNALEAFLNRTDSAALHRYVTAQQERANGYKKGKRQKRTVREQ